MAERFKPCSVQGCNRNAHRDDNGRRGFCRKHYDRLLVYGDPTAGKLPVGWKSANGSHERWLNAHMRYAGRECLLWPFPGRMNGYGAATVKGRSRSASRHMCEMAHGHPPRKHGYQAAHSCGNRLCVNPNHLRWATYQENQMDRVGHGTSNRGSRNGKSRLIEEDVRAIRDSLGAATQTSLAKKYGVSEATISLIANRKKWDWLE